MKRFLAISILAIGLSSSNVYATGPLGPRPPARLSEWINKNMDAFQGFITGLYVYMIGSGAFVPL